MDFFVVIDCVRFAGYCGQCHARCIKGAVFMGDITIFGQNSLNLNFEHWVN